MSTSTAQITTQEIGEGLWPRAAAKLIDLVIVAAVSTINRYFIYFVATVLGGGRWVSDTNDKLADAPLINLILGVALSVLWYTILEGLCATTPGKAILGLIVVKEYGTRCDFQAAWKRSLGLIVDLFFFGLIGALSIMQTLKHQRRGDLYARTIVIKRSSLLPGAYVPTAPLVVAFCAAAVVNFVLVLLQIIIGSSL